MGQITKQIKGKIIFKHKTEADWKLSSYVPDEGEQIIYDPDESHANPRIKIGDGQKTADELPFTTAEVPTKISEFENDAGYLKTESDPTVPSWAKAETKPSYTKAEIGLGNVDNVKQYSESNPPPYPVTSVNGTTGAITIKVPTKVSELTNDSGFITASQAPETSDEIYVGDGDMPETATIQLIMDGVDEEQALKDDLKDYINGTLEMLKGEIATLTAEMLRNGGVVGYIDENNNIVISGNLADGTYTLKYENEDETYTEVGSLVVGAIEEPEPTNFADPTSEDWLTDCRLSFSGSSLTTKALTGAIVTNFITGIQVNDIVKVEGINFTESNNRQALIKVDGTVIGVDKAESLSGYFSHIGSVSYDNNTLQFTVADTTYLKKLRFSGMSTGTAQDVKITITRNGKVL